MQDEVGLVNFMLNMLILGAAGILLVFFGFSCIGFYSLYLLKLKSKKNMQSLLILGGLIVFLVLLFVVVLRVIIIASVAGRLSFDILLLLNLPKKFVATILLILTFSFYIFILNRLYTFSHQDIQARFRVYAHIWEFWNQFKTERVGVIGLAIVLFFLIIGVFANYLAPYEPFGLGDDVLLPPSLKHYFGSDHLGRDTFSRIIWGTRMSFIFGFVAAGISLIVGIFLGALPGYYGGWVDDFFSRSFEVFLTIPTLILVILVVAMFSTDIKFAIIIVGLTMWPSNAKITRAQVLSLKNREYVLACKGMGGRDMRILFMHIVPNGMYPIVPRYP